MKLIVGLGNPGSKYQKTRHNLGFLALEELAEKLKITAKWKTDKKFNSLLINNGGKASLLRSAKFILAKPQIFVNNSGEAVKKIVNFYEIEPENILIIRDDIDLPEGKIRGPKTETGSGGHLGIESIRQSLGIESFYQLKIGVGRPPENLPPADFVLQRATAKEWKNFENIAKKEVVAKVQNWINE